MLSSRPVPIRYVVLGAGRQGTAAAYALARFFAADEVVLADADGGAARAAAARVDALLGQLQQRRAVAIDATVDARDPEAVRRALEGSAGVLSAVPYPLNPGVARAAIAARASFTDLGGNTDVVKAELALDREAAAAGVSVVPDAGLAPGLSNALAALALARLPDADAVRMWCGGLPESPQGPLRYKLVFNVGGLTNEYTGKAVVLRDGRVTEVDAMTEPEEVEFPAPVGRAEAFLTSGGTSTCPWTWQGRLRTLVYKTVRYPGHFAMLHPLVALGFLDTEPVTVVAHVPGTPGARPAAVSPRDLAHRLLERHIVYPSRDLVVLRVVASSPAGRELRFEMLDREDEATGFTAMERATAFPAAALLHLQATGGVAPGARSLETAIDPERYFQLVLATGLPLRVEG